MHNQQIAGVGLSGYRALDLTDEKGFLCGKILADLGADVIKIEPPGGDSSRNLGPFYHNEPDPEKSLLWWTFNTSKRGITLDLTKSNNRTAFLNLVKNSDFVIESFTPGHMAQLGLSYEELSEINPGIIFISISGFGQDGPYSQYNTPDIVSAAMGGLMNLTGTPDRPPLRITIPQAYLCASNDAAIGALIALWYRERTGAGQLVDVSTQECITWLGFSNYSHRYFRGLIAGRDNPNHTSLTPGRPAVPDLYQCKDGYVLFTPNRGRNGNRTRKFMEWMNEQGMANNFLRNIDWENATNTTPSKPISELTDEEREQLINQIYETGMEIRHNFEPFILTKTKEELFEQAVIRGYMLAPVNTTKDVLEDIHFQARNFWQIMDHPEVSDKITYPGAPYIAVDNPYEIRRIAPLIGEHNNEILQEEIQTTNNKAITSENKTENLTEAFKGLKIIDFTWVTVGPRTLRYFADHGATVIKIESPERPDVGRLIPPHKDNTVGADQSGWFALYNVNKLGVTIDLNKPDGVILVKQLIKQADVLVESFRPGVMKKWGLDYDSVKKLKPGLIYASTSMFGQSGPYRNYAGYGYHAAAMTGFDEITGWPDRMPCGAFWAYTDHIAPQYLATAITVALLQRKKTGKGQYIDQAQNEAALQFLAPALLDYAVNGSIVTRNGNRDQNAAPHNAYRCNGNDRWCVISIHTDEDWRALCRIIGQPLLTKDKRFATMAGRKENEDELDRIIEEWTSKLTAETIMNRLQEIGIAAGIVETAEDMYNDPQLKHRNHFLTFDHPVIGPHPVDALPPKLSKSPARQYRPEPCLGEHNAYVCTEILDMSDEEFIHMVEAGVFGQV